MSAPNELSRRPLASFIATSVAGLVLVVAVVTACAAVMVVMEFFRESLWILTVVSFLVLVAAGFAVSQPARRVRRPLAA